MAAGDKRSTALDNNLIGNGNIDAGSIPRSLHYVIAREDDGSIAQAVDTGMLIIAVVNAVDGDIRECHLRTSCHIELHFLSERTRQCLTVLCRVFISESLEVGEGKG